MRSNRLGTLILSAVVLVATVLLAHAEERTIKVTSAWVGAGDFFQVKDNLALFVGSFEGVLFVDNLEGALNTAKIICPGMVEINLDNSKQSGEGRCVIMKDKGDHIYAQWQCAGEHLAGCVGPFKLLGGKGKFKGITGSGEFQIRSNIVEYAATIPGDRVEGAASGVAVWPALTYKLP